ncbi:MAG: hypothetical protein WCG96_10445, partial [Actinomycetes bacterium]
MIRRILLSIALTAGIFTSLPAGVAFADGPQLHSAGSTWVQIAMQQWTSDVNRFGLNVDYQGIGSTAGREDYMYNLIDFAATEIPYRPGELDPYTRDLGGTFRTSKYGPAVAGGPASVRAEEPTHYVRHHSKNSFALRASSCVILL